MDRTQAIRALLAAVAASLVGFGCGGSDDDSLAGSALVDLLSETELPDAGNAAAGFAFDDRCLEGEALTGLTIHEDTGADIVDGLAAGCSPIFIRDDGLVDFDQVATRGGVGNLPDDPEDENLHFLQCGELAGIHGFNDILIDPGGVSQLESVQISCAETSCAAAAVGEGCATAEIVPTGFFRPVPFGFEAGTVGTLQSCGDGELAVGVRGRRAGNEIRQLVLLCAPVQRAS